MLRLHNEKGVNPRLTVCRNCGKDVGVALLGAIESIYECSHCRAHCIGGRPAYDVCTACGFHGGFTFVRKVEEQEKLPVELCDDCKKNEEACAAAVAEGGVYWKCSSCGSQGAIKSTAPLAQAVRKQAGIETPKPVGVEFSESDCPVCGPNKVT